MKAPDLEKMTKAELVGKLDGVPGDVLAFGRVVAALEPLVSRNWRGDVIETVRLQQVMRQTALRFGFEIEVIS